MIYRAPPDKGISPIMMINAAKPTHILRILASIAWLLLSQPSWALVGVALQLETGWEHNSNPYRLPDGQVAATGQDRIQRQTLKTAILVPVLSDETRLALRGVVSQVNFNTADQLDHTEKMLDAKFGFALQRLIRGELGLSLDDRLFHYQDSGFLERDMNRQRRAHAEISLRLSEELEIPMAVEKSRRRQDYQPNQLFDRDSTQWQLSLRHSSPLGSVASLGLSRTENAYPHRSIQQQSDLDSRNSDAMLFIDARWRYSPLTELSGRLVQTRRSYENLHDRDFSQLGGELRLSYQLSSALRLGLDLWNMPRESTQTDVLYYVGKGGRVQANWQYSPLLRLQLFAGHEQQSNALTGVATNNNDLSIARREGGRLVYQLNPSLFFTLEGARERIERSARPDIRQHWLRAGLEYRYENLSGLLEKSGFGK